MTNPETDFTAHVRRELERLGCYFMKISDRFSIGIPDATVATRSRVVVMEFKVLRSSRLAAATYRELGLSGAQDSRIREVSRRTGAAYVVAEQPNGAISVWVPIMPSKVGQPFVSYRQITPGEEYEELTR